jgi:hypothetical protein
MNTTTIDKAPAVPPILQPQRIWVPGSPLRGAPE